MKKDIKPGKNYIGLSVFALIFYNNEFLLVQSLQSEKKSKEYENIWSMPGGTVEFGETCEKALLREIKEETNLDIDKTELINYNDYIKKDKHWVALNFKAKTKSKNIKNLEPNKNVNFHWFNFNNIPENISPFTKECLKLIK